MKPPPNGGGPRWGRVRHPTREVPAAGRCDGRRVRSRYTSGKHRASRLLAGHTSTSTTVDLPPPAGRPRKARNGRFMLVGAGGVGVNNAALLLLHGVAAVPLMAASVVAVELAVVHNYVLNEVWTFRPGRLSARRFGAFNTVALGALAV